MSLAGPSSIHDLISDLGYRLIDDDWERDGRRTYISDENFSASEFKTLATILTRVGWERDSGVLWMLRHPVTGETIEVEPGGPDTSGSFLHHLK